MRYKIKELLKKIRDMPVDSQAFIGKNRTGYSFELLEREVRNVENLPFIELKIVPSCLEYGIINVTSETRGFFPGYRRQFLLRTDFKPFVMHLTGAPQGTVSGEEIGGYLCHPRANEIDSKFLEFAPDANHNVDGSFKRWYEKHQEIKPGDSVKIYRANSELFKLEGQPLLP